MLCSRPQFNGIEGAKNSCVFNAFTTVYTVFIKLINLSGVTSKLMICADYCFHYCF